MHLSCLDLVDVPYVSALFLFLIHYQSCLSSHLLSSLHFVSDWEMDIKRATRLTYTPSRSIGGITLNYGPLSIACGVIVSGRSTGKMESGCVLGVTNSLCVGRCFLSAWFI